METARPRRAWKDHEGQVLDEANGFEVIECVACAFKHVVPIPTSEELVELYTHSFYTKDKPLYLERHKEDLDWWNLVYSERYDVFERELPADRRRILDIGSGPGFFLLHGKRRGWNTVGIEPSKQAATHARELGLKIVEAYLDERTAVDLGRFDAIHMSEVLEHIPHPGRFLTVVSTT